MIFAPCQPRNQSDPCHSCTPTAPFEGGPPPASSPPPTAGYWPEGATEGCVKSPLFQCIQQSSGLQQATALLRAETEWVSAFVNGRAVRMDDQASADVSDELIPKRDHFRKLIRSVDVQKGEWNLSR